MTHAAKPLGIKNYGSIGHLPNSRLGDGDHSIPEGQARICTIKKRNQYDTIHVQEKLDGSNVGVALVNDQIIALGRAGYPAQTSKWEQHQLFAVWVRQNEERFRAVLREGERLVGEWLAQAHGTRYDLATSRHEPFVVFDLMVKHERLVFAELSDRIRNRFFMPMTLTGVGSMQVETALGLIGKYGYYGAIDPIEGLVYRVERDKLNRQTRERKMVVDFLAKWVRPDKVDGEYLPDISGKEAVWNWRPT